MCPKLSVSICAVWACFKVALQWLWQLTMSLVLLLAFDLLGDTTPASGLFDACLMHAETLCDTA